MGYNKNYLIKKFSDPLPSLEEDDRIYLSVPYIDRGFAKEAHCGFDSVKKLWFTGIHNTFIKQLVEVYGVNDVTSEKARELLEDAVI